MRTTSPSRHVDPAGQDATHLAQDTTYDHPRRRRAHHDEIEDDDRQEQVPCRSSLRRGR